MNPVSQVHNLKGSGVINQIKNARQIAENTIELFFYAKRNVWGNCTYSIFA